MYLKLDSSFSNYKINFITYLRIQPVFLFVFLSFFLCFFFFLFFLYWLRYFLEKLFKLQPSPFRQVPRLNNFTLLHCAQQFPPHPLPQHSLPPSWVFFFLFFFLVGQVGNEKSVSFLVPGQSGSNLFLFFSFFLTLTVQPPSVSRQRCHRNICSGRCYLMKEEKNGEGKTERGGEERFVWL